VDLKMASYCESCMRCVRACPGNAISLRKVWYRGVFKRKLDDKKCFPYFEQYDGCGICLKVCPIGCFGYDVCMSAYEHDGSIPD
jgi:epoxyqueuosine reductase QueG